MCVWWWWGGVFGCFFCFVSFVGGSCCFVFCFFVPPTPRATTVQVSKFTKSKDSSYFRYNLERAIFERATVSYELLEADELL